MHNLLNLEDDDLLNLDPDPVPLLDDNDEMLLKLTTSWRIWISKYHKWRDLSRRIEARKTTISCLICNKAVPSSLMSFSTQVWKERGALGVPVSPRSGRGLS